MRFEVRRKKQRRVTSRNHLKWKQSPPHATVAIAEWVNRLEVREDSLLPWISIWEGGSNCIFIISILEKMFM
jgi:hypothetical protein